MKNMSMKKFLCGLLSATLLIGLNAMSVAAAPALNYSTIFDPVFYSQTYPDLQAAYGNNANALLNHYVSCGIAEGRQGSPNLPAGMISTYSTSFDASAPRATNIMLAASKVNGAVIPPGGVFSYNGTVGPRTAEGGYVEAPIYVSGTKSTGIGGGICQVSSTIYAASLLAGLTTVERHQHSLPVHYLPSGMDATVSYGTLDLKIANPYSFPIVINASADNGTMIINISHAN